MKVQLVIAVFLFGCLTSIFGQTISKNELKEILQETLIKSRDFVPNATNSWIYDNSEKDYETKDTLILNTARSLKRDYCQTINWTFYKWNKFQLEVADYCNEPPTKLASKDKDYFQLLIKETDGKIHLMFQNQNNIQDKFEIIELVENLPLENDSSQFAYTLK
ncbi:hypothetical protein APR41_18595 [Salegentibacter salinarum]|uniref:Uncharacterized protein n=1 Tax=Salegentibacter salinarum TaxID=447422 RepID=A0A2N0TRB6_9FLAO|nr:hypothetical protein [Salegentibacter salinarum]PKD17283.1 hypothetical protein APR41_18595 [Salegentibacter salinarum]SKC02045.1 hypothetical protein SAMN05660903_03811 [Salegentibacter salinarum]